VAIEDAGFEIRDNIAWMYASGFPKSLDVSKAIDKSDAKVERRARDLRFTSWMRSTGMTAKQINQLTNSVMGSHYLTDKEQPAVPTEDMFTLLRPYLPDVPEDIERLVFERTVESKNFAEREVIGQRNVPTGHSFASERFGKTSDTKEVDETLPSTPEAQKWQGWGTALKPAFEPVVVGRKPIQGTVANNVLAWGVGGLNIDGSRIGTTVETWPSSRSYGGGTEYSFTNTSKGPEYAQKTGKAPDGRWPANVILDEVTAGLLDEQSGVSRDGVAVKENSAGRNIFSEIAKPTAPNQGYGGQGGASRFFYVAKASKRDRNEGLEELQNQKLDSASYGINSAQSQTARGRNPEKQNYAAKNFHPTVKPTQLMRYLIKLVTPPGGVVLDPFTGSGSTGKAALLDGFEFVGAELTEDYLPIIEGRLKWAVENREEESLF